MGICLVSFHNTLTVWCLLIKNSNSQFLFNSALWTQAADNQNVTDTLLDSGTIWEKQNVHNRSKQKLK